MVLARPTLLRGQQGKGHLGGTEMQDRLHILEDLNMLYIRQMALSLEVTPPPLECTSSTASQPISALPFPAGAEQGEQSLLQVGRGIGGSVSPSLGAPCGPRFSSAN